MSKVMDVFTMNSQWLLCMNTPPYTVVNYVVSHLERDLLVEEYRRDTDNIVHFHSYACILYVLKSQVSLSLWLNGEMP